MPPTVERSEISEKTFLLTKPINFINEVWFLFFGKEVNMNKQLGSFLVLFKPGVITGVHNESEVVLKDICDGLGGLDCKIFDPYMAYARLADDGFLVRVEQRNDYGFAAVSFFYPTRKNEHAVRRKIINEILGEIKNEPELLANGYAVISDKSGNLKLRYIKNRGCSGRERYKSMKHLNC